MMTWLAETMIAAFDRRRTNFQRIDEFALELVVLVDQILADGRLFERDTGMQLRQIQNLRTAHRDIAIELVLTRFRDAMEHREGATLEQLAAADRNLVATALRTRLEQFGHEIPDTLQPNTRH